MNLQDIAELGYACGLDTIGQSLDYAANHWDTFPPGSFGILNKCIEDAAVDEIGDDMLCVHFLGAERCAEMDRELEAYFARAQPPHEPFDEFTHV